MIKVIVMVVVELLMREEIISIAMVTLVTTMVMTDDYEDDDVVYVTEETKLWLSPSVKQCQNPWSGPPPVYKDLSTRHDWRVKKAIVDLLIRLNGSRNALPIIC